MTNYQTPTWIKVFSWIFCMFLIAPLFICTAMFFDEIVDVSGYGFKFEGDVHQKYLSIILMSILFLGGITGLAIICRWKSAYRIGIIYSIIALLFMVIGHSLELPRDSVGSAAFQGLLLIFFLVHLIINKSDWVEWQRKVEVNNVSEVEPFSECNNIKHT